MPLPRGVRTASNMNASFMSSSFLHGWEFGGGHASFGWHSTGSDSTIRASTADSMTELLRPIDLSAQTNGQILAL
uniref:Uncharacterized protein n=1 Tax=Pseudomonas marincola TaxID=437900 RepID=A0A653EBA9_9PSED